MKKILLFTLFGLFSSYLFAQGLSISIVGDEDLTYDFGDVVLGTIDSITIQFTSTSGDYNVNINSESNPFSYPDVNTESIEHCGFTPFAYTSTETSLYIAQGETKYTKIKFSPKAFAYSSYNGEESNCLGNIRTEECFTTPICLAANSNGLGDYETTIIINYSVAGVFEVKKAAPTPSVQLSLSGKGVETNTQLGLNDNEADTFSFYPNPSSDKLNFSETCEWQILTPTGLLLHSGKGIQANISLLNSGTYMITTKTNNRVTTNNFIKQ